MSYIFGRPTRAAPPVAAGGKGRYGHHESGQRYLDVSGGAAVIAATKAQLDQLAFARTGDVTSEPAEALADLAIAHAPEDFDRVYLMSGAIDGARGDHILLVPPFIIEDAQRDELADKPETAVSAGI